MQKIHLYLSISIFTIIASCSSDLPDTSVPSNPSPDNWLVPSSQVFDGGPGKDGIPSIDDPQFIPVDDVDFLSPSDLVLGIAHNDVVRAYPHPILDWHEIVNDQIGNSKLAITYCPLTGTGVGWNRIIQGEESSFGVSGLLYNTNLMPYDRKTNSTWSQQRLDCVNGELVGDKAEIYSLVETTWATWKEAYPNSEIMSTETGFSRNYGRYPYNDYRTNQSRLLFPITNLDDRLPQKERTLGVILETDYKVYTFDSGIKTLNIMTDDIGGVPAVIVRSKIKNFMVAFEIENGMSFELIEDSFPVILADQNGVKYDLLGRATEGGGENLKLLPQFIGYWFSWGTFYPDIDLHED